jgi:hypothetical protein
VYDLVDARSVNERPSVANVLCKSLTVTYLGLFGPSIAISPWWGLYPAFISSPPFATIAYVSVPTTITAEYHQFFTYD